MHYRNNQSVVITLEGQVVLVQLYIGTQHVGNLESLVVLFYCCLYYDLLLLTFHVQLVYLFGVWQVADSPLERVEGVLSYENWLC